MPLSFLRQQGSKSAQYLQVGNAVPPLLARAVVEALVGDALRLRREDAPDVYSQVKWRLE